MAEEQEEIEIILPDDELEIEVQDDTPAKDKGKKIAPEVTEEEDDDESLPEGVGERVKKRIDKLTAEKHAERRAKEALVRERDEAVRLAKDAMQRAQASQQQTSQYEQGFVHQAKTAADSEIDAAKAAYAKAYEDGDVNKMLDASQRLTKAQVEKSRYDGYVPAPAEREVPVAERPQPSAPQITAQELARQTKFIQANPWLNRDEPMTKRALEIDQYVRSNAAHIVGTDEYYDFIDTMMRQEFPSEKFGGQVADTSQAKRPPGQTVAPVNRAVQKAPRKVTLTATQLKLCRTLGIKPEQYAREQLKMQKDQA